MSKIFFYLSYLEFKKTRVLNELKNSKLDQNKSLFKIAEAYIKESGTATKYIYYNYNLFRKLDFIIFEVENNLNHIRVRYGAGLNANIPTKSPLNRNLLFSSPAGDTCSQINSPEATD